MKTITNKFKIALAAIGLLAIGTVSAQQTSGTYAAQEKVGKSSELNGTIRVIDNKGTKKYLQVKNGLTLLTDQTPDGGIVSTWQLGGVLTDNTYITAVDETTPGAGDAKEFALDGLELVTDVTTASDDAVRRSSHGTGTGFTVLIKDEASGAVQKIKLSDLLQVQSEHQVRTVDATNINDLKDATASATGIQIAFEAKIGNVQVFRNGAKLKADTDYKIKTVGTDYYIYLIESTTAPNDWTLFEDDEIELHAIK